MTEEINQAFPPGLLTQPPRLRAAYFKEQIFSHYLFQETLEAVKQAIDYGEEGQLILLFGPTGVGKTTLKDKLLKDVLSESWEEMEADPGWLAAASLKATAQDQRPFDWIDYYQRALLALNEPLIERKLLPWDEIELGVSDLQWSATGHLVSRGATPKLRSLRMALENCLKQRRPRVFIVDEAPHLQRVGSGKSLRAQLDIVKSLAERSDTLHLLLGTYDLLEFTNLNGQLGRRTWDLHFPRYQAELASHEKEFKRLLRSFERVMPLPQPPDLVQQWEFIYDHCLGCIGLLKAWLLRALGAAWAREEPSLSHQRLQQHKPPPDKLLAILREIKEGERRLEEGRLLAEAELVHLLGPPKSQTVAAGCEPYPPQPAKPFERKLGRDRTGGLNGG